MSTIVQQVNRLPCSFANKDWTRRSSGRQTHWLSSNTLDWEVHGALGTCRASCASLLRLSLWQASSRYPYAHFVQALPKARRLAGRLVAHSPQLCADAAPVLVLALANQSINSLEGNRARLYEHIYMCIFVAPLVTTL